MHNAKTGSQKMKGKTEAKNSKKKLHISEPAVTDIDGLRTGSSRRFQGYLTTICVNFKSGTFPGFTLSRLGTHMSC